MATSSHDKEEANMESSEAYPSRLQSYIETWLVEKSRSVLEHVVELVELYKDFCRREDLPEEFVKAFPSYFGPVIYNSTKILSFAADKDWSVKDPELIWENGRSGLDEVLAKYGLVREDETAEGKKRVRTQKNLGDLKEVKQLLNGTRYPSRTLICEFLRGANIQDQTLDELRYLTERLTMGELSWAEYVNPARTLVENLIAIYAKKVDEDTNLD